MGLMLGILAFIAGGAIGWTLAAIILALNPDDRYDIFDEETW